MINLTRVALLHQQPFSPAGDCAENDDYVLKCYRNCTLQNLLELLAMFTHPQLVKQGVDARLHVWEGMFHGFFYNPDVPESQEVYRVVAEFFARSLGRH